MSARVLIDGLDELRAQLRNLPATMATEASEIVNAAAAQAETQYRGGLAEKTGRLKAGVTRTTEASRFGTAAVVRSAAKIAYIYDNGSGPRQTQQGANRGRMPASPESTRLIPIAIRARATMYRALSALLQDKGFEVSG